MYKLVTISVVCCFFALGIEALAQDSIPDRFYREQISLEIQSLHPYLMDDSDPRFYEAGVGYYFLKGVRNQPFGSLSSRSLIFDTRSRIQVRDWEMYGEFSYRKLFNEHRPFLLQSEKSAALPYLVLDNNVGPWAGDKIDFLFSIKSPYYGPKNKMGTSMTVSYEVGSSTRRSEPRPLANHNGFNIAIQQALKLDEVWHAGFGFGYRSDGEEIQIGSYSVQDFRILQARGWYTFTSNTFQSFQRRLFVNEWDYLFFLSYQKKKIKAFSEFKVETENSEIRDGIAFPIQGGNTNSKATKLKAGVQYKDSQKGNFEAYFKFLGKNLVGTDPVFGAVNIENGLIEISNELIWQSCRNNPWQIGSNIDWRSFESTELAANASIQLRELIGSLYLLKEIQLSGSSKLYLRPSIDLQKGEISQVGNRSTELSELLLFPMRSFYGQEYWEPGLGVFWEQRLPKKQLLSFSISYSNRVSKTYPLNEFVFRTSFLL